MLLYPPDRRFLQAVEEMALAVEPLFEDPENGAFYKKAFLYLTEPERIISFKDYSPEIIGSMIKAVNIPDEFDEKPRLLGLLCENDAVPALDTAGLKRIKHSGEYFSRLRRGRNTDTRASDR